MAINWGDVIKTALAIVGGSAGLLAVLAWLIKAVISQALVGVVPLAETNS
jgi:hypothetical protein